MNRLAKAIMLIVGLFTLISISASPHPFLLLICYLVHELGHILTTRLVGGKIRKITVGVFKIAIGYDTYSVSYGKEFIVSIAGIIFNLMLALFCYAFNNSNSEILSFLVTCNLSLALVNLYPVSILDGGRLLKLTLLAIFSQEKAEKISRHVSFFGAILLWFVSIYLQLVFSANISMLLISVFLLIQLCFSV